jgi:hypothetical protein
MGWVGMEKEMRSVRDRNVEVGKGLGIRGGVVEGGREERTDGIREEGVIVDGADGNGNGNGNGKI